MTKAATIVAPTATSQPATLDWALLAAAVLLWGSSFAGLRIATQTIAPVWIIAGRMFVASAFLAIPAVLEMRAEGRSPGTRRTIGWGSLGWHALIGIAFTALPYLAYATAARTTDSAVLAICNGAAPIFTAILAHFLVSGERLTARRIAGVTLGFLGLGVLVAPSLVNGAAATVGALVMAIVAAGLYAVGNIAMRRAPPTPPIAGSFMIVATGFVAALACAALAAPFPEAPSLPSLAAVAWIGFGPTGLAMIICLVIINRSGPVFVSFATYLTPLWALALGVAFLHERPGANAYAALALVLAGVWIANSRARR